MKGKLIVIEGLDSSGKETQSRLLCNALKDKGLIALRIEFPNYKGRSSELVKMYLEGQFGKDADSVNPYAASTFYAADRYATYKTEFEKNYNDGAVIVADRYTTSNLIHQAGKIKDEKQKDEYINWLLDFEYNKMQLPEPDLVIFLHMPVSVSVKLMENRINKAGTKEKDIHEANIEYLKNTYKNAIRIAKRCGFKIIECTDGENVRSINDIHMDIIKEAEKIL